MLEPLATAYLLVKLGPLASWTLGDAVDHMGARMRELT